MLTFLSCLYVWVCACEEGSERRSEGGVHVMGILTAAKCLLDEREGVKAGGQMGCEMILWTKTETPTGHTGQDEGVTLRETTSNFRAN